MRRHAKASSAGSKMGLGSGLGPVIAAAALSVAVLLGAFSSTSFASHRVLDFFGEAGEGNGQFTTPIGSLAPDQASGDIYAVDTGGNRVERFDADGDYVSQFGSAGAGNGEFSFTTGPNNQTPGIAVDQNDGSVYVADPGNNRIEKFDSTGTFLFAIGLDVDSAGGSGPEVCLAVNSCQAGAAGSGNGEFSSPMGVAVGPGGALYVADTANNRIQKFSSEGVFQSAFGTAGTDPGQLEAPAKLAVDSTGRSYVLEASSGRIQRFDATGAYDPGFTPDDVTEFSTSALAVDLSDDHIYVVKYEADFSERRVFEFDQLGTLVDTHGAGFGSGPYFTGLALINGATRIYIGEQNDGHIYVLTDPGASAPEAIVDPVTVFNDQSASLTGTVNPHNPDSAVPTDWVFEVSSDGGSTWTPAGSGQILEGTSPAPVSANANELEANEHYDVRLVASKPFGIGSDIASSAFTTELGPPSANTIPAFARVGGTTAIVGGYVNPRNSPTSYWIEYGTADCSLNPCQSVPASQDANAGSGSSPTVFTQQISGLNPSTTYHARLLAHNVAGTTFGDDVSFITPPATSGSPTGRVYERVSPVDKNGASIERGNGSTFFRYMTQVSTSGDAITFASKSSFSGAESLVPYAQYLGTRGSAGWSTKGVSPPYEPESNVPLVIGYEWFNSDLSTGAIGTNAAINAGDPVPVEGDRNLYLRDTSTSGPGAYKFIGQTGFENRPVTSSDGSQVAFNTTSQLTPGGQAEGSGGVYEWDEGQLRFVSVLPGGTPSSSSALGNGLSGSYLGDNPISADGSRIFFTADGGSGAPGIYVRENGTTTREVAPAFNADFMGAKASDGSIAFFTAETHLTGDATGGPNRPDLYRWDAEAAPGNEFIDLTIGDPEGAAVLGTLGISDDANTVYFAATGNLAPGATPDVPNIYVWQLGKGIRHLAALSGAPGPGGFNLLEIGLWSRRLDSVLQLGGTPAHGANPRITADGSFLLFSSYSRLTAYDNAGYKQVYLYDLEKDLLTCISCSSRVSSAAVGAYLSVPMEVNTQFKYTPSASTQVLPQNVSMDGSRAYFDTEAALIPEDSNGRVDVYEWNEGTLRLISSGSSAQDSTFIGASDDADDVFFATAESLARSDEDVLTDIYDFRVGGSPEIAPVPGCVGDECQGTPSAPPRFADPGSSGFASSGNPSKDSKRCRKGERRVRAGGRVRCKQRTRKGKSNPRAQPSKGGLR